MSASALLPSLPPVTTPLDELEKSVFRIGSAIAKAAADEPSAATAATADNDTADPVDEKSKRRMTTEAKAKRKAKRREKHLEKLRAAGTLRFGRVVRRVCCSGLACVGR